jgi:hypothetical protein
MENPNGVTFSNGDVTPDKTEIKTSQTSLTSQTPINTDSQGGTLSGTFSDNVPKTSLLCPADNVQNVPPPEVPTGAASGKSNPHEGDIRDIRDVFIAPLSGGTSDDQGKSLSVPKSKDPDCGGLRVGDWVRYRGNNQTLRMQCDYSRRVQIVSIDGETAQIKSPKWIVSYQVALHDLVLDRRA